MPEQTSDSIKDRITGNPAAGRLKEELGNYLQTRAEHAVSGLGEKLGNSLAKLGEGRGDGDDSSGGLMKHLAKGGKVLAEGGSPAKAALSAGGDALKDKVTGLFKGKGGKGGGGSKSVNIVEDIDVGVPVREAYDQWTQFQEFSTFAKGVVSVEKSDDTTSNWRVKVAKSTRSWKANVTEQIPDERIAWTTDGAKGTVKGVVTFHPITDNLTRVLLNLEYFPQGLFEKTGNIWRAQGRRARLDLKLYRKFIMMRGEATDGWRGEIRDGEVVLDHDDAVAQEEDRDRTGPDGVHDDQAADSAEDVDGVDEQDVDDQDTDEYADEDAPDDGPEGDEEAEYDEDDEYEDEYEDGHDDDRPARPRADDDEYEQDELPEGHGDGRAEDAEPVDDDEEDEFEYLDDEDVEDEADDDHAEDDAEQPEEEEQPRRRRTASRR